MTSIKSESGVIPTEHKASIITDGIAFMRTITNAYGPEEGMKLWDRIADALDPDIKGEIFFAMVTGNYHDHIRVHSNGRDRVATIKAFRTYDRRGLGLKEAKDLSDSIINGKPITLQVEPRLRNQIEKELMSIGCQIS